MTPTWSMDLLPDTQIGGLRMRNVFPANDFKGNR